MNPFFPTTIFAWTFTSVLVSLLVPAVHIDSRRLVIPKWISLTILGVGLAFNLARGAWLGALGLPVWCFGPNGTVVGAVDGLLFSLAGFFAGFGIFFVLWGLGTCGGGDVKLFAALSAWVGPGLALWVLAASAVMVAAIVSIRLVERLIAGPKVVAEGPSKAKSRVVTYALPITIATAVVLVWTFWGELGLGSIDATSGPAVSTSASPD
jgi:Flp pilus assembly protein protease CpaA